MALAYICSSIDKKDVDYLLIEKYRNRLKKLEDGQAIQSLENHMKVYRRIYFKRFSRMKKRLIIEIVQRNSKNVFLFRAIIPRKNENEYQEFQRNLENWLKQHPIHEKDEDRLQEITLEEPENTTPEIEEGLIEWLQKPDLDLGVSIFESSDWVNKQKKEFKKYWIGYHELLFDFIEGKIDSEGIEGTKARWITAGEKHILLQELLPKNLDNDESKRYYFLFDSFYGEKPSNEEINKILQKYTSVSGFEDKQEMLPFARRAYPEYLLAGQEDWFSIEQIDVKKTKDQQGADLANLALSGEEMDILRKSEMPIFINGHAGSGKSTMLLYLFSGYLKKYFELGEKTLFPLFLTYNKKLLEESKNLILQILTRNDYFKVNVSTARARKAIDMCMFPFQTFIIEKMFNFSLDEHFSLAGESKHINYARFKDLYSGNGKGAFRGQQQHSPALVWHTIRALIKGCNPQKIMEPKDYEDLPRDRKNVQRDTYSYIYNEIYDKWYKNLRTKYHYWDDMDLVRHALSLIEDGEEINKYPVVFCDEAQDFTTSEFQLLMNLQKLMEFDLSQYDSEINIIPVSFAGDHLQTINPTGFRWADLTSSYYEVVKNLKIPDARKRLQEKPLKKNYRSVSGIVDLANWLQFYRYKFLPSENIGKFVEQESWIKEEWSPKIFIDEDVSNNANLEQYFKDVPIIIPVDEGEEEKYIKSDPILSKLNKDNRRHNIYSAGAMKGLELSKIVLYKFGQDKNVNLTSLTNQTQEQLNENESMELSYFLNKLYVGITRAKENLFVFDSKLGVKNLWSLFTKEKLERLKKDDTDFIDKISMDNFFGYVVFGQEEEMRELILKVDDLETYAGNFEKKGKQQNRSDYLRTAAVYYKRSDNHNKYHYCMAESYFFAEEYEKAGDEWNLINESKQAALSYWEGQCWIKLEKHENKPGQSSSEYPYFKKISEFMNAKTQLLPMLESHIFIRDVFDNLSHHASWKEVIKKIIDTLKRNRKKSEIRWNYYAQQVDNLVNRVPFLFGGKDFADVVARYYFNGQSFADAAKYWDKLDNEQTHEDYYWAKYFSSNKPKEQIDALMKLDVNKSYDGVKVDKEVESLINRYFAKDKDQLVETGDYFMQHKEFKKAIQLWDKSGIRLRGKYFYAKIQVSKSPAEKLHWMLKFHSAKNWKSDFNKEIERVWKKIRANKQNLEEYFSFGEKHLQVAFLEKQKTDESKDIARIVDSLENHFDWIKMIQLIQNEHQPSSKRKHVIYAIAENQMTKGSFYENLEQLRSIDKSTLYDFVNKEMDRVSHSDLEKISAKQILLTAIAYEKVNKTPLFSILLPIYEHLIARKKIGFGTRFNSKKRWLGVKYRQMQYEEEQVAKYPERGINKAESLFDEIERKKQEWRIKTPVLDFLYPFPKGNNLNTTLSEIRVFFRKSGNKDISKTIEKLIFRTKNDKDMEMKLIFLEKIMDQLVLSQSSIAKRLAKQLDKNIKNEIKGEIG